VDRLSLSLRGFNFNIFQKYHRIQHTAFVGAIVCLAAWIAFGFDSTPLQFIHAAYEGLVPLADGVGSWQNVIQIYHSYYGKEMHWSAFVIYFLLFWGLSKSWEKAAIIKSKNLVFSFAAMFLAIGIFEWFWILSFSCFQNQPWVSTWRFPQMKILLQNTAFTLAGGLTCLYMLTERWHWNGRIQGERAYYFVRNWKLWLCIGLSVAAALFWIYYPFQIQQISVNIADGTVWHSSRLFPQTLYTVDLNPVDGFNAGVWFYQPNNLIHGLNTLVKVISAAVAYQAFRVRKP
jgi:hypothetical protein